MHFLHRTVIALLVFGVSWVLAEDSDLQKLVIGIPEMSLERECLTRGLAEVAPMPKIKPRSFVTKDGRFILYGDLFKTGGCFALVELPEKPGETDFGNANTAFAEWVDAKWKLQGAWSIPAVWRPKGWKWNEKDGSDYLPVTPATEPFALCDFNGDGIPEVIIAGDVAKYYQEHYLLRFDSKTHRLILLESAMRKPMLVGGYVRLYFNSGRRAIYEEWRFSRGPVVSSMKRPSGMRKHHTTRLIRLSCWLKALMAMGSFINSV